MPPLRLTSKNPVFPGLCRPPPKACPEVVLDGPFKSFIDTFAGLGDGRFSLCINVLGVDWQRGREGAIRLHNEPGLCAKVGCRSVHGARDGVGDYCFMSTLPRQGLYDPKNEHDSCGVAFVAHSKGEKSHDIVRQGLQILVNLEHRGAVGADPLAGDGAGILIQTGCVFTRGFQGSGRETAAGR